MAGKLYATVWPGRARDIGTVTQLSVASHLDAALGRRTQFRRCKDVPAA